MADAYDGHDQLRGVWGGNSASVPKAFAQQANNRFFREDFNRTRPMFWNIELTFESEAQRAFFQAANGQGATFYNTYPSYITPRLVASLGGRIYTIEIQGKTGVVKQLFDGNSRQFMHAWFGQGFEWLVIQDGISPPVLWNGKDAARRSDLVKNEVPIGSVMEFIHGRFVLATADGKNTIRVSEIVFANTNLNTNDILTFPPEIPSFDIAASLGSVNGLYAMPFLDTGTGQNELVAMCDAGFTAFNFSGEEATFLTTPIQRISLIGTGLASSHGFAGLNGDVFYRAQDGISSYRNARVEYSQGWRQTPISREVNYWIKLDRKDLLEFIPMVSWQNMVFTGCSPLWDKPNNPAFGWHRYCRGMVVFDVDSMSTAGRDGTPVWHGMWSGIRPWAFAQGMIQNQDRCFAFSYDRDGVNRLYEMTLNQGDDLFETQPRRISSFYTTGEFGTVEARTNAFAPKRLNGGVIEYSELLGQSHFTIEYRPDGSPCWVMVTDGDPGCECPTRTGDCPNLTAAPQWGRAYFPEVNQNTCVPGSDQLASVFHHCQVKVGMLGPFTVNRLNIRMELQPDSQTAKCIVPNCAPIDCCPASDDYAYHIAPVGVNTNVPVVPPDPQTVYVATRIYTATCTNFPSISFTATGQATSQISQEDANTKAQQAAYDAATAGLVCPNCTPSVETSFLIDGGTEDLSEFFVSGLYGGNEGRPWRLFDVFLNEYIASGIVNDSGTLQTFNTFPQYLHGSFNAATNVYSDNGDGSTRISLELGCSFGGEAVWPTPGPYGT